LEYKWIGVVLVVLVVVVVVVVVVVAVVAVIWGCVQFVIEISD
jgi:hypothetical protein